jgi:hypothetical protein
LIFVVLLVFFRRGYYMRLRPADRRQHHIACVACFRRAVLVNMYYVVFPVETGCPTFKQASMIFAFSAEGIGDVGVG